MAKLAGSLTLGFHVPASIPRQRWLQQQIHWHPGPQALAGVPGWTQSQATKPGVSLAADLWAVVATVLVRVGGSVQWVSSSCSGTAAVVAAAAAVGAVSPRGLPGAAAVSATVASADCVGRSIQKEDLQATSEAATLVTVV